MNWQRLARANTHPLRISILEALELDGGRVLSPKELSVELQAPLSNVNYHVTELLNAGLLELVGEQPVRGATEHFYRSAGGPAKRNGRAPSPNGHRQEAVGRKRTSLEPATSSQARTG